MAEAHSKPSLSFRNPPKVGPINALQQIKMRWWHPKQTNKKTQIIFCGQVLLHFVASLH